MRFVGVTLLFFILAFAFAVEDQVVCAKYMTESGWSENYKVEAKIAKGSELNTATKTFDYNSFSTYVVIFWDQDEVSILELESYFGSLSPFGHDATDQIGREWNVSSSPMCY